MPAEQLVILNNESGITPPAATSVMVPSSPTPAELLRIALSQNADIDKLKQLMDLQERWEADQARKAFVEAMSAFKAHSICVVKDRTNSQYSSKYVSLGNLVQTVTPFLSQHGLSVSWQIDQTSGIKVSCRIQHIMGHFEAVTMVVPPDTSGQKNPIQQIKSAITYAKACTFESICGLASTDANVDDDGNASGKAAMADLQERVEYILNGKDREETRKLWELHFKAAKEVKDTEAMAALTQAKNKRFQELGK